MIAEGGPAVEPLLAALASDARLTRSLSGRGMTVSHVHPVSEVIYAALKALLKTDRILADGTDYSQWKTPEERKRLAEAARAYWEKNPRCRWSSAGIATCATTRPGRDAGSRRRRG